MVNGSSAERVNELSASEEMQERASRIDNLRAFISSIGFAAGLVLVVMASVVADSINVKPGFVLVAAATLLGICTAQVISLYLKGRLNFGTVTTVTVSSSQHQNQGELLAVLSKADETLKKLADISSMHGGAFEREKDTRLAASREVFAEAKRRLSQQGELLERRARVGLVTGSSTTVVAVTILLAFAFTPTHLVELSWQLLLSLYLPKLGVVIMLEVFAFFFLRIYKTSLEDSRALNRDLDMLALKEAALITSWAEDPEHRLQTAKILVTTEGRIGAALGESDNALDPKAIADLAAAIAKIVRGS